MSCGCSGYFLTHQLEYAAKDREKQRNKQAEATGKC